MHAVIEVGDGEGARRFVQEMEARWLDSEEVQHDAHVLVSPKASRVPGKRGHSMDKEFAWLRER